MKIYFRNLPGRPDVPHVVTEASQVTYPHVIIDALAASANERLKYLGTCAYTAIHGREATPAEFAQWQRSAEA